jgi:hypothetical protein
MAMERRQKLQDAIDHQNEVRTIDFCLSDVHLLVILDAVHFTTDLQGMGVILYT